MRLTAALSLVDILGQQRPHTRPSLCSRLHRVSTAKERRRRRVVLQKLCRRAVDDTRRGRSAQDDWCDAADAAHAACRSDDVIKFVGEEVV